MSENTSWLKKSSSLFQGRNVMQNSINSTLTMNDGERDANMYKIVPRKSCVALKDFKVQPLPSIGNRRAIVFPTNRQSMISKQLPAKGVNPRQSLLPRQAPPRLSIRPVRPTVPPPKTVAPTPLFKSTPNSAARSILKKTIRSRQPSAKKVNFGDSVIAHCEEEDLGIAPLNDSTIHEVAVPVETFRTPLVTKVDVGTSTDFIPMTSSERQAALQEPIQKMMAFVGNMNAAIDEIKLFWSNFSLGPIPSTIPSNLEDIPEMSENGTGSNSEASEALEVSNSLKPETATVSPDSTPCQASEKSVVEKTPPSGQSELSISDDGSGEKENIQPTTSEITKLQSNDLGIMRRSARLKMRKSGLRSPIPTKYCCH